jgi:hypothetical protein
VGCSFVATETTGHANSACWRKNQPLNLSPKRVITCISPVDVYLAVSSSTVGATWGFTLKQVVKLAHKHTWNKYSIHTCNWWFRCHRRHDG